MHGFCPLASGSKGNCLYFGTKEARLLIDAGISAKMVRERLAEIAVDVRTIDAILITHEHTDHIKGLAQLACKLGIPVFANSDTAREIYALLGRLPQFKLFVTGEPFVFRDVTVHPFSVQHDTVDPVAFTLQAPSWKVGVCADLGCATALVAHALRGCDYLYLEANHQPSMVHASARPMVYKQRVLSRQGHLSNEECAELAAQVAHAGLKHVYLAHLSSECNAPDLALRIVRESLERRGYQIPLSIAYQDRLSHRIIEE
jgi:phosphoribosyl 1,2-cyclic phosphodiesterase